MLINTNYSHTDTWPNHQTALRQAMHLLSHPSSAKCRRNFSSHVLTLWIKPKASGLSSFLLHCTENRETVQKNNLCSQSITSKEYTVLCTVFLISFSATGHFQLNTSLCQLHKSHVTATIIWNCTHKNIALQCVWILTHTELLYRSILQVSYLKQAVPLLDPVLSPQKQPFFTGSYQTDRHYLTLTHMTHAYTENTNNVKQTAVVFRQWQ
jgi:hypothetical protein